jgi:hypothetical protein
MNLVDRLTALDVNVRPVAAPAKKRRRRVDHDLVRILAAAPHDLSDREIAARLKCSATYVRLVRTGAVKLKAEREAEGLKSKSRFVHGSLHGKRAMGMPPIDHPAIMNGTTLYPDTVIHDLSGKRLLKPGTNQSKIGGTILKGKWKGMPVFTLTLEERKTCPKTCHHWRSCFGNGTYLGHRISHESPDFERRLVEEVIGLQRGYPSGFVVRLHVLGDFFSVRYVNLWRVLLEQAPALNVFGYSARHTDDIGIALRVLVKEQWARFAIRFSDAPDASAGVPATISIEHPYQNPADAIICPSQLPSATHPEIPKTESCSSCTLCWSSRRRIAFVTH